MTLMANSIEGKAAPYLKRIESLHSDMETAKIEYMNKCKARRQDVKDVLAEAEDAGVPKKPLKGLVKYRLLEKKAEGDQRRSRRRTSSN